MKNNNLTSGIYVKCLPKQVLGFRIFVISLLQWGIAYVGVVMLRSRDGVIIIIIFCIYILLCVSKTKTQ